MALGPHKIDLVYLLFILDKPPKTLSKLLLYEVRIVSFADVALIVNIYSFLINPLLIFRHRLSCLLINHVIKLVHIKVVFGIKPIFSHKDSINEEEELLLFLSDPDDLLGLKAPSKASLLLLDLRFLLLGRALLDSTWCILPLVVLVRDGHLGLLLSLVQSDGLIGIREVDHGLPGVLLGILVVPPLD